MWEQEIRNLCRKLKPLLGKRADALWTAYLTAETPRSRQETKALSQMIASQYLSSSVGEDPILLPPPSQDAASGEFLLGIIYYARKALYPVYLRRENFIKHIGGGGKTNVAQTLGDPFSLI